MTPAVDRFDYGPLSTTQADELRATAPTIRSRAATMTPVIIDIGRNLLVAKQTLPHGRFLPWVKAKCGFASRGRQAQTRLGQSDGKLPGAWKPRLRDFVISEAGDHVAVASRP